MSNIQSETKRVIQIKPILKPIAEYGENSESQVEQELIRLKDAKEELELVKQQQKSAIADTEYQIKQAQDNWEQEKNQWIEKAKEEGFQAGFANGEKESKEQFHYLIEQANSIIATSKKDYQSTIEKSEEAILLLAVQVAEKIMKQELKKQADSFLPIVKDAISSLKDQRELAIYLPTDIYEYVVSQKSELERILDSKAKLSIYVNESLEAGSCVIEYPFGKVDASIGTQLSQIKQVLHEIVMEQKE